MTPRLPEKVIQFGTGILLRGLPDFFIDKANKQGVFNGSIVVIKSTEGSPVALGELGYRTYVRGIASGEITEENIDNDAISRILSARDQWDEVMKTVISPEICLIISNTTEVGLQLVEESIFSTPPSSFPAKLTAMLYERFVKLGNTSPKIVIVPTELIPDNGKKLHEIVMKLVAYNKLDEGFSEWIGSTLIFCDSLVDRIVTRPSAAVTASDPRVDAMSIQTEPYRLWAIEGSKEVEEILSFAQTDSGVIIAKDISYYRERKLRLLNGTHTISVCLGFLMGHDTVIQCMQDHSMKGFISGVMMDEILPTLPAGTKEENKEFGREVLERFSNPFTEHKLLSITLQSTMKMRMRNIPTIIRYYEKFGVAPQRLLRGLAAYLIFMRAVKLEHGVYYGVRKGIPYAIQDDKAAYFHEQWQKGNHQEVIKNIFSNEELWGVDLNKLPGFRENLVRHVETFQSTLS